MHVENAVGFQAWPETALLWKGCLSPRECTVMPGKKRTRRQLGTVSQPALCHPQTMTAAQPCFQRFDHSVLERKVGVGLQSEVSTEGPWVLGRGKNTL